VTPSEFRAAFPDGDFNVIVDATLTDAYVQKFLDDASKMFNVARWGALYSEGLAMYVADRIVQSKMRKARGIAKPDNGALMNKHVGAVGAGYDSQILNRQAEDTVTATPYGRRYAELRDMVGLGGTAGE
jgi:hypothetical protein